MMSPDLQQLTHSYLTNCIRPLQTQEDNIEFQNMKSKHN